MPAKTAETTVWFQSACSKCRGLKALLDERGCTFEPRYYLEFPPTATEVEDLLRLLGMSDPIELMRRKEAAFAELGIQELDRAGRIAALASHPQLLARPILVRGDRAVVARPPQKALELFEAP